VIQREGIIRNASWIASDLPTDAIERVIARFQAVLREEIEFHRKFNHIKKS